MNATLLSPKTKIKPIVTLDRAPVSNARPVSRCEGQEMWSPLMPGPFLVPLSLGCH